MKLSDLPPDEQFEFKACLNAASSHLAKVGHIELLGIVCSQDDNPVLVPVTGPDKLEFANVLRAIAVVFDAKRVITVSEAWAVKSDTPEALATALDWRKNHDSYEDYPGRYEILSITVENEAGLYGLSYKIARDKLGEPWIEGIEEDSEVSFTERAEVQKGKMGNLTDLFPPAHVRANPSSKPMCLDFLRRRGLQFDAIDPKELPTNDDEPKNTHH